MNQLFFSHELHEFAPIICTLKISQIIAALGRFLEFIKS
jgi:hypothetical protein